jgi:formylmethanofuran dehydrogenase subunit E
MRMAGITKAERERRAKAKAELEELLEENGLYSVPTCKVCRKTPDKIAEYKYNENPIKFVLEHERLTKDGKFYCTTCYVKAGMPLF